MTDSPYFDEPAADFIEADGRFVYVLVGSILDRTKVADDHPVHILVAPDAVREYDFEFLPLFIFFKNAREEYQVKEWFEWAGGDDKFFKILLKTGAIVRVDTRTSITAAKSLKGLRLIPQCIQFEEPNIAGGFMSVTKDTDKENSLNISIALGAMFEKMATLKDGDAILDIPATIKKMVKESGLEHTMLARHIVSYIPMLLQHEYARLEWVKLP